MRVGVYVPQQDATAGGGGTFVESVQGALGRCVSRHTFVIFFQDSTPTVPATDCAALSTVSHRVATGGLQHRLSALTTRLAHRLLPRAAIDGLRGVRELGRFVCSGGSMGPTSPSTLDRLLKSEHIDVAWFPVAVCYSQQTPFFITVWDLAHIRHPYLPELVPAGPRPWGDRHRFYSQALPRAARVITGTETGKREIIQYYNVEADNVVVIPLPVGTLPDSPGGHSIREKYSLGRDYFFYPAQFWPHKNHVNLLLAFNLLVKTGNEAVDLVFCGADHGNLRHVQDTVSKLGLTERVHFLGLVPRDEMRAIFTNAVALVFPSLLGPDNMPPLEAFSVGCPVAAADVPGVREQLGDGALLFDPCDPQDMAGKMERIHRDADLRTRLVKEGAAIAGKRTDDDYVRALVRTVDAFEPFRRCWGAGG